MLQANIIPLEFLALIKVSKFGLFNVRCLDFTQVKSNLFEIFKALVCIENNNLVAQGTVPFVC